MNKLKFTTHKISYSLAKEPQTNSAWYEFSVEVIKSLLFESTENLYVLEELHNRTE